MSVTLLIILCISLFANVVSVFYIVWLIKNLSFVSNNLNDMDVVFRSFADHLESVHEMEMFYGDSTLSALIEHSKMVKSEIENYRDIMDITEDYEEVEEQEDLNETQKEE